MNTKENIFRSARLKAAAYNETLSSMDSAAPQLYMDRSHLQRIETGGVTPDPGEVLIMADTYRTPRLLHRYCSEVCPVGRKIVDPVIKQDIDGVTVDALGSLMASEEIGRTLLQVSADHKITPDEKEKLTQIIGKMRAIGNIAKQLELMMQEV